MNLEEITVSGKTVYHGRIFDIRRDEVTLANGRDANREVVEHSGGVSILPLTAQGDVIMVRQYRYPMKEVLLELPAGKLKPGEDPTECAHRELKEETGLSTDQLSFLGAIYPSPGFCTEILYLYLAQDLRQGEACPDEDEILSVERVPLSELLEMIQADRVRDAKTVTAVLKAKLFLDSGKFGIA